MVSASTPLTPDSSSSHSNLFQQLRDALYNQAGLQPILPPTSSASSSSANSPSPNQGKAEILASQLYQALSSKYRFIRLVDEYELFRADPYAGIYLAPISPSSEVYSPYYYQRPKCAILEREATALLGRFLDPRTLRSYIEAALSFAELIDHKTTRYYYLGMSSSSSSSSSSSPLYWDTESASIVLSTTNSAPCFIRLFDKSYVSPDLQHFTSVLTETYSAFLDLFATNTGAPFSISPNIAQLSGLSFILDWADGDQGLYWDILVMLSTVFMKHKPLGAYFLIGPSRNGKSACANLLKAVIGPQNYATVRLSQIDDPHFAPQLQNAILNAPDDEDDDLTRYQGAFKELASHAKHQAAKLYSSTPYTIDASHTTFLFPVNTIPNWKGSSASACMKRTISIPFTHSFESSKSENAMGSFERRTYTPEVIAKVSGIAMALATYFHNRPDAFAYSGKALAQKQLLTDSVDTFRAYKCLFEKYFCGFSSQQVLYDDYRFWCAHNEYEYGRRKDMKIQFLDYFSRRTNRVAPLGSIDNRVAVKCYCGALELPNAAPFHPDLFLPEFKMTVTSLHNNSDSVVAKLEEFYEQYSNTDQ